MHVEETQPPRVMFVDPLLHQQHQLHHQQQLNQHPPHSLQLQHGHRHHQHQHPPHLQDQVAQEMELDLFQSGEGRQDSHGEMQGLQRSQEQDLRVRAGMEEGPEEEQGEGNVDHAGGLLSSFLARNSASSMVEQARGNRGEGTIHGVEPGDRPEDTAIAENDAFRNPPSLSKTSCA